MDLPTSLSACQRPDLVQNSEMSVKRLAFLKQMFSIYIAIVGSSTLVAVIRFSLGEDGSLHHFIATTSNHLVLARISASLLSWGECILTHTFLLAQDFALSFLASIHSCIL